MEIEYRRAVTSDLKDIVAFVDYWLTGGGKKDGIAGAGHDYFVRFGQQKSYIEKYDVLLACCEGAIVGWAVKTKKGVLIHLLVAATFRGSGIGGELLRRMAPSIVRSKFDQESGDPAEFYRKRGYVKQSSERVGKKKNIDIFVAPGVESVACERSKSEVKENRKVAEVASGGVFERLRAIGRNEAQDLTFSSEGFSDEALVDFSETTRRNEIVAESDRDSWKGKVSVGAKFAIAANQGGCDRRKRTIDAVAEKLKPFRRKRCED